MALSEAAKTSLAGIWGGYDFYLIRDDHFQTASDMVERFLELNLPRWRRAARPGDVEFLTNLPEVRTILMGWAEKKLNTTTADNSIRTIQANIMFKQLLYGQGMINFGSVGTNWNKKTEIAAELNRYKPWSVAHASAVLGGMAELHQHVMSIIETSSEASFFEGWWKLTHEVDRPMLFPQVWGHTSGKLWLESGDKAFPAFFSFGLINVVSRTKLLIQCEPKSSKVTPEWKEKMNAKQNLATQAGWLVFRFSDHEVIDNPQNCFDRLERYFTY
ncbi:MAG TPA: hypothetical protein VN669_15480 [Candidatus Acidoferrales bacterium]|nr:hypothetical protein [Candidatus Acidoferrales bacterium]